MMTSLGSERPASRGRDQSGLRQVQDLRGRGIPKRNHCPRRTVLAIVNKDGCFADYITLPVETCFRVPGQHRRRASRVCRALGKRGPGIRNREIVDETKKGGHIWGDGQTRHCSIAEVIGQARKNPGEVTILSGERHGPDLKLGPLVGRKGTFKKPGSLDSRNRRKGTIPPEGREFFGRFNPVGGLTRESPRGGDLKGFGGLSFNFNTKGPGCGRVGVAVWPGK